MLQAIAEAHNRRVLLLVFVEGEDTASQSMRSTFDDPDVEKLLDVMGCVPIRLRANSSACRQFTLVYPVTAVPSTFFISSRGNLESSVVGCVDPVAFGDRLASLMASANIRKVDSDMRNAVDLSVVTVDRMFKVDRQPPAAKFATPGDAQTSTQQPPPITADAKKKDTERRKRKKQRNVANVQTSIPALAEQATQINWDDICSYGNLMLKLATMEESPRASAAASKITDGVLYKFAPCYVFGNNGERRRICKKPAPADESVPDPASPPPSTDLSRVPMEPTSAKRTPASFISGVQPLTYEEMECVLEDVLDGPSMLVKFAVLAQEFADKVLSNSLFEDQKSLDAFADVARLPGDSRKSAASSAKKKEARPTKTANASSKSAKREKRRSEDTTKKTRRLENLGTDVGDSPNAMKTLGDKTTPNEQGSRGRLTAQSSKQHKSEAPFKAGTGKSKKVREAGENAGRNRKLVVKKPIAPESIQSTLDQVTKNIKLWEALEPDARAAPPKGKGKKTAAKPSKACTETVEVIPPAEIKGVKESEPLQRTVIQTILEEEACPDGPPLALPPSTVPEPTKVETIAPPVLPQPVIVTKQRKKKPKCPSPITSKEFLTASNSQLNEFVVISGQHEPSKLTAPVPRPQDPRDIAAPSHGKRHASDGDDETVDDEDCVGSPQPLGEPDPEWLEQVIRAESRRAMLGRMDDSVQNICRVLSEVESHTLSLNHADKDAALQSDKSKIIPKPSSSVSKQRVRVIINDNKEHDTAPFTIPTTPPKSEARISVSGINVRGKLRKRASVTRISEKPAAVQSSPRKCASVTPVNQSQYFDDDYNGNKRNPANIVLNLPDGSSVLHVFPADAYLDEVRWRYAKGVVVVALATVPPLTASLGDDFLRAILNEK
ncbi:UBX domain-containing protein, putative [Ixodes scapularis]|uniref:UBX domain-containing protein, putative n=1 Tax=Ixodes scapularis TaxID=6945 RepID=B7P9A6_IXOSC|nr:UBX domain-containing protein, putative [Ixodes scapularis]|eukprot:XP_002403801.1 UBX domain-containing protein, putative [Ixodes scapularis]